jgi:cyclopropane-fatty-acyl-phospholipid synthase
VSAATARAIDWTERGLIPDAVIRHGIRRLLRERLAELRVDDCEALQRLKTAFIATMRDAPIAPLAHKANEQHYELPAEFFTQILGSHCKYSCGYWPDGTTDLERSEAAALRLTGERSRLTDAMEVLELGCGWGALTLWMAERYPNSRITAVSNSRSQRAFIMGECERRGLGNIDVITRDMNEFSTNQRFDRVVSVEMFEHMRNYPLLFERIANWLKPDGYFFAHIFCHRDVPYAFVERGDKDWMSRFFFSGGMMPSDDLPLHFQDHLSVVERWRLDGMHYEKTANAWLSRMDGHKAQVWPILERVYGKNRAQQWWMRWRIFFMACAELFGYQRGQQWWVSHYLFRNRGEGRP